MLRRLMMANANRVIPPMSRRPAKPIKLSPLLPVLGRVLLELLGLGLGAGGTTVGLTYTRASESLE